MHLPRGVYLFADGGYSAAEPLLIPFGLPRRGLLDWVRYQANIELGRALIHVEHRIGDARVYRSTVFQVGREDFEGEDTEFLLF